MSLALLTVAEVARRTGVTPQTVYRWIRAGRIQAEKIGHNYYVWKTDFELLWGAK